MSDTMKKFQDYFDALDDLKQTAKRADNNEASDDDVRASFAHVTSFYRMTDAASARDAVTIDQLKDAVIRAARTVCLCGASVRKDEMREACIEGRAELQNTILALDAALSAPAAPAADAGTGETATEAAMDAVQTWSWMRCDLRNDRHWHALRGWEELDANMSKLMTIHLDKLRERVEREEAEDAAMSRAADRSQDGGEG